MAMNRKDLEQFAARERERYEQTLREFVEVPSISADPERKKDVERMAELGAAKIRAFGGQAEIHRVEGGSPIVLGSLSAGRGAPTVTVYNHLDVQPASRRPSRGAASRSSSRETATRYYGRGTTDDKGPALAALFGARARARGRSPGQRALPLGDRGGDRLAALRDTLIGRDAAAADRLRRGLRHDLGRRAASPASRPGCAACSASRFALETGDEGRSTRASPAAPRATRGRARPARRRVLDARTGR